VAVTEESLRIPPDLFLAVSRKGRPYLELSPSEVIGVRSTFYALLWPAVELRYQKGAVTGTFTVGFCWQRKRFLQALRDFGFTA
jgi:hypothetical protein